ncbi:MAG: hypothetical protein OEV73_02470 [Desulfobulbaceae bacterium]|nr:hypothetical protein [Desulfobulbaceae bacterium]
MLSTTKEAYTKITQKAPLVFFTALTIFLATTYCALAEETSVPEVITASPDDQDQAAFLKAMEARAKGDLMEAADIFNNILQNKPLLHRARLELAVTYYRLYDYAEAKALAQSVLDDPKTPPNVRVSVLAFIAQVEKDEKAMAVARHFWKPTVALGWMHDTNVNVGPDSAVVDFGTATVRLAGDATRRSDSAAILIAALNHRYQTGKTVKVGEKNTLLYWQSNASFYRRDYFNEHAYDMDVVSLGTGPALIAIHDWRANLNCQVDALRLGSEKLAYFYSLLPSYTKELRQGSFEITLDGTLTLRDYQREIDAERDSRFTAVQLSFGKRFRNPKMTAQAGGRLFTEDAETGRYSNNGHEVFLAANWTPWTNGSIFGRIKEIQVSYDGPEPLLTTGREDRQNHYTAGISQTLQYKWLKDVNISFEFSQTENHSNSPLYDYDRKQVTLMASKTF